MNTKERQVPPQPKLVVLNRALKLAEEWTNKMSVPLKEKSREVELEARPPRLGIGATAPPESVYETSNDPVGRRLRAKLNGRKIKVGEDTEQVNQPMVKMDDDDSDDEFASKVDVFTKRKPHSQPLAQQAKKLR